MIFNFLRQFLKDDEFEKNKLELAETRSVLNEYKSFIQEQREQVTEEKVDPDFLVLVWAAIGFASYVFLEAGQSTLALQSSKTTLYYFWLILAVFSLVFIIMNSWFAIELTKKYSESKSNPQYLTFTYYLIIGVVLIAGTVVAGAFLK